MNKAIAIAAHAGPRTGEGEGCSVTADAAFVWTSSGALP